MEQFSALKNYLSQFLSIPPLEWLHFAKCLGLRRMKKDDMYFRQGETFDEIGFVVKGLLYNYYTTPKADEFVKNFAWEGNPVTCYSNLMNKTPADFSCRVLEDCTLVTLKYKDLLALYERHKCWEKMGRVSAENLFQDKENREKSFLLCDAKERYENFVRQHPQLIQRVPQYLIASYLGMTPVSLSRIRKET